MGERNTLSGILSVALSETIGSLYALRWMFLLAAVLLVADLRFGIMAARKRGEEIRFSRAVRRTADKAINYVCWILVAGAFGQAFGVPFDMPLLPLLVLLVVYGCELNSCFANYFEAKGKRVKIDIFKLFAKKADIIEMEEEKDETK